jgi:hypothetical protein
MAALEVLALDTSTPQIRAPGSGDTYAAPRALAVTANPANTSLIAGSGYSLTGSDSTPMLDFSGDWATTGTPTALRLNIATDTGPSNAASNLLDLQVGGSSRFRVTKGGALNIAAAAVTGSADTSSLNITQTWNTSGTPTGIRLSVTDTASNAASNLLEIRGGSVGTASLFAIRRAVFTGTKFDRPVFGLPLYNYTAIPTGGFFAFGVDETVPNFAINIGTSSGIDLAAGSQIGWKDNATNATSGTRDVILARDAAQTLAQRNGTAAQTFRIYNTYTAADNFERGKIEWASNVLQIGTEKGTVGGTARALEFQTDGVTRLVIEGSGTNPGVIIPSASRLRFINDTVRIFRESDGLRLDSFSNINITWGGSGNRLNLGGNTSSFPALKRDSAALVVRLADDSANAALESASVKTDAPAGGTSGTWKLGVAATVTPTSPNRTIEVDIGGTIYYIHAKTTND